MSLSLLIAINVVAGVTLLAGLAYAMSRAARLTPHVAAVVARRTAEQQPASPSGRPALQRAGSHGAREHGQAPGRTGVHTAIAADASR